MGFISFLIVLSILVFIHELGHFLTARYFGVTVYDFSIGFGKKLYSKYYKGTTWSFSLIPLGGYVRMKGQEDLNPSLVNLDKDSYQVLSPIKKIFILFAGPAANFALALVLYFLIALIGANSISPTIGKTIEKSPAQKAGLLANDEIIAINQIKIKTWSQLSDIIENSQDTIVFFVKRNDNMIHKIIVTAHIRESVNIFGEKIQKKMVGITPAQKIITIKYNPLDAVYFAFDKTFESSKMIFLGIQKMLQGIIPSSEVGGVITIGKVISDASNDSMVALFSIMALISVNLGVLNLLPIPALDGGHIMFNIFELIFRKKPNAQILIQLTIAGWVILFGLMALGLYNDVNRLLG